MSILDRVNSPKDLKNLNINELKELCNDIREEIITTVTNNGGHLASALGVVELTVAMHYIFDAPKDKIIFDVGHQSYAHKLLTRKDKFSTLRKFGGECGFTRSSSSPYDTFISGHSSTSLSVASGLMRARELGGEDYEIISIIGDGALTGGMTHEALNDSGSINGKQIIILNDNNMSISKSVGSTAIYLANMHTKRWYSKLKNVLIRRYDKPHRKKDRTLKRLRVIRNSLKYLFLGGLPFDQYGIKYFGPVDGHNLEQIIKFLTIAKNSQHSAIIHIATVKGYGYEVAENDPDHYHGVSSKEDKCCGISFSEQAGITLTELARNNDKIVAVTAAMSSGTGLTEFMSEFPNRFFDVAIAEAHAATMCAAMASSGFKPYFAVYSTFLQRAFDQVIHDICIEKRNVTLLVDRAGIVGPDGETHQGIFDISYLNMMPNMAIAAPADLEELDMLIKWSVDFSAPLAIRYPKGSICMPYEKEKIALGKWSIVKHGNDNKVIIATGGDMLFNAYLAIRDKPYTLINARFIKPMDYELLDSIADKQIFVVEDGVINGGLYSSICSWYSSKGIKVDIKSLSIGDCFVPQGTKCELMKLLGLDADSISRRLSE